jgi:GNAT superfamily N-acetyltransferase
VNLQVRPIAYSEPLFAPLLADAEQGGGAFMLRLRDEWLSGAQRFDGAGEFLVGAFRGEELAGVGGVSRDPYDQTPGLGRVRHLYVLQRLRGMGVGGALVEAIVARARGHWQILRLRTSNPNAARLYERHGFQPLAGGEETHLRRL